MDIFVNSILTLFVILLVSRVLKRHITIFQKYFIPSSLIAGIIGLILGPQIIGIIPSEVTSLWSQMPKHLIIVVFAGLFLGKHIPKAKKIWELAGPMISFGMIIAWGHYVIGLLLTIFILTPIFGANPLVASLIEISFQGGHGTVAGLANTFNQLGWPEGTDIGYAIATLSIVVAIISGILFINIHARKKNDKVDENTYKKQKQVMIRSGYNLAKLSEKLEKHPEKLLIHIGAFAISITIGWFILRSLISLENIFLTGVTEMRFFRYLPLFPLAMIGGLIVQLVLMKIKKDHIIDKAIIHNFSTIALDFLIASALATVSLNVIGENYQIFLILSVAGIVWILGSFVVFAPIIFKKDWFVNGITNIGQAMGVTATGLLLNRLSDPGNKAKAREIFGYKQLIFEMFMGGGIITAISAVMIFQLGTFITLMISLASLVFWLAIGLIPPLINKR